MLPDSLCRIDRMTLGKLRVVSPGDVLGAPGNFFARGTAAIRGIGECRRVQWINAVMGRTGTGPQKK
jgi:hypothetical protein